MGKIRENVLTVMDDCPRECLAFRAGCERNSAPQNLDKLH